MFQRRAVAALAILAALLAGHLPARAQDMRSELDPGVKVIQAAGIEPE